MQNNRMYLIFHGRFPSEKAHALFAAKGAEAFAQHGEKVTLLVPRRFKRIHMSPYEYYGLEKNFKVIFLPTLDLFPLPILKHFAFRVSLIVFSFSVFFYLLFAAKKKDLIYSNETLPLLIASVYFRRTVYEIHDFPEKRLWFYRILFRRVWKVLVTNKWKIKQLEKKFSFIKNKIFFETNAVDIEEFDIDVTKEAARIKLELPEDKKIILYTGHLYGWKGVDILAKAAKQLPKDHSVYFVGGTEKDIAHFTRKYSEIENIRIIGHRPHTEMPLWQKAADVLVLPNTAKEDISKYYTAPMKLFEYMASGKAIVASRIPSVELIVSKNEVFFFEPDNETALSHGITKALTSDSAVQKIESALSKVREHTWFRRSGRIIAALEKDVI